MSIFNTPLLVNGLELHNRLVMPPMATAKAGDDGKVTEALCSYYHEKTQGGFIGLVITEHSYVSLEGKAGRGQVSVADDSDVEGLSKIARVIHQNGSKAIAQISHAGAAAKSGAAGCPPIGASSVKLPWSTDDGTLPRAMTQDDIKKVVSDFTRAAERVKRAGFDGVEIHSAHAYLLNQFYSPLSNKRDDEYTGRTLEGRIRLHLEIIQAVRKAVGKDYPVALRLGACDYMPGGSTIRDSVAAAQEFERAGIDLLDISGGFCFYSNPNSKEQGYFREISEEIKKNSSIPVILTGGIVEARAAESLLRDGAADLIGVGRAILKDSQWAKQAAEDAQTL